MKCFECSRASLPEHERAALDSDITRDGMGTVDYCDEHRRALEEMFAKFGGGIIFDRSGDKSLWTGP